MKNILSYKLFIVFSFLFLSIGMYSQIPRLDNLIAYYSFSGDANDDSGNGYDGVLSGGPTLTQNRFGNSDSAYTLDGVDDYIYFGNAMYADFPDTDSDGYYKDSFSISIWAKSSVSDEEAFVAFGEDIGLYTGMISRIGANISFNSSNWGVSTSTSGKKGDNNWHHYVLVYDAGNSRRIYIDGSLAQQFNDSQLRFNFKNYGVSVGKERFNALGTESLDNTYTGSMDDIRIWNDALTTTEVSNLYSYENNAANEFIPETILGTNEICNGDDTTLTVNGGSTNSNTVDVWYTDACGGEAFHEGWDTQPYTTQSTTVNSTINGILNVTTTSGDPMINMFNLGSFDPSVFKYINIRYKVVSGTAGDVQIFFLNSAITVPNGGYYLNTTLISDNAWHIATLDMSAHADWTTGGNITGWRYDYATNSGATLEIDFIELGSSPVIDTGTSIVVTPNTDTAYYVSRKGPNVDTACISQLVTVGTRPIPTFATEPASLIAIDSEVTYTTESGQTNYVWTIPGVLNTDYSITSGGTSIDNAIVLKWLTTGNKTITVNYANANSCSASVGTSSITSYARKQGLGVNGLLGLSASASVDRYGAIGADTSISENGDIIITQPGSGLTADTAAASASAIKAAYPSSGDGVYWITNPNINGGTPFQIYADMITDGGGWMLLNVGAGNSAAPESSTVTSPDVLGYLPRATVIELAMLCTDVQLRAGGTSTSYANKTTSTSPLAIGALQSTANDVNGAATWANGASSTFVVNSGSWLWAYCCPGSASGWPKMYHSSNYTEGVHWFADLGVGRKNSAPRDAWFSTWIR